MTEAELGIYIFYGIILVTCLIMLAYYTKSKKSFRSACKGMLSGAASLLAVHFFGGYAGLYLPLNCFTTVAAVILGAPAVIIMALAEKFIM